MEKAIRRRQFIERNIADVLFGDFKPTGKLSCSWPRSMAQVPVNAGDASYDPLLPAGFGLTFAKNAGRS